MYVHKIFRNRRCLKKNRLELPAIKTVILLFERNDRQKRKCARERRKLRHLMDKLKMHSFDNLLGFLKISFIWLPNCQNSKYLKDLLLIYAKVHLTQQKASPHMIFNSINIDLRFFTFFINDPSEIFKIFFENYY